MMNLDKKYIDECSNYIVELSNFSNKVCNRIEENENVEVIKTYIGEFGSQLEELVKFIQGNDYLKRTILEGERDLKFALESFGDAFHSQDYNLCEEILKYEFNYILCKWQDKLFASRK